MIKHLVAALGATVFMGSVAFANDDGDKHDHGSSHMEKHEGEHKGHHDMKKAEVIGAEVRKVMGDKGKVSLKHGEIPSHQMPPMTMVFKVKDKTMLEGLQKGDNVEFSLDDDMVITAIQKK